MPTILRNLKNIETRQGNFVQLDLYGVGEPQPDVSLHLFEINSNEFFLFIF